MDGFPKPKTRQWRGQTCSETRCYINTWLEKEIPKISGRILNIGAGGSQVPRQLLNVSAVKQYTTFDKKTYGGVKNNVDIHGDIESMPAEWTEKWDAALCIEVMECVPNVHRAMDEIHRVLRPGGIAILTCPFAYTWFGFGSTPESLKKLQPVSDYWRISEDGWRLITSKFSKVEISGFGGEQNSRYVYCVKAVK
jgi:SAM-dependent methyltransferase